MQVFRDRARRGHHDRHTDVTTNGTRIITTNNGRGHPVVVPATHVSSHRGHRAHRGTTTVVAANVPSGHGHGTHARSRDQRRYYRDDPSTIHGLWNKILGTLTGNRRRKRHGDREMRKARERKDTLRAARGVRRVRATDNMTKLRKFGDRHHQRRHDRREPIVIAPDRGRKQDGTPWLHHSRRTLPPYHGMHHRIMGFFTRRRERRAMGEAMAAAAAEQRRRERMRRREEMQDMGRRYRERGRR